MMQWYEDHGPNARRTGRRTATRPSKSCESGATTSSICLKAPSIQHYTGRNEPAYVEREKMTPAEAVEAIIRLGGVPCLAHPREVAKSDEALHEILSGMKGAGPVAMEAYYKAYDTATVERLLAMARDFDLLALGGSDYHGLYGEDGPLPGGMYSPLPEESIEALLDLGRERSADGAG